jgi:glycosyltransferase involved in cell wall biosynthesis
MEREIEVLGSDAGGRDVNTSVVVCTYNRCQSLFAVLEGIAAQHMPDSVTWEVVVVDNNSTDKTREVVEEAACKWPGRFRYVFEGRQGLSQARNTGVRAAQGAVIAFTDDDVMVDPDWLCNLTSNLHSGDWAATGGRIVPVWAKPLPDWMSIHDPDTMGPFGVFDFGENPGPLARPPYGANMAFHRRVFEQYGLFRTDLGRSGTNLQGREDTELGERLLAAGEPLRYEPHAAVFHPSPASRMTKKHVLRWWFWFGYGEIAQEGLPSDARWTVNGIPLYLFRRIVRWFLQWIVTFDPPRKFVCIRNVWFLTGIVFGCHRFQRFGETRTTAEVK